MHRAARCALCAGDAKRHLRGKPSGAILAKIRVRLLVEPRPVHGVAGRTAPTHAPRCRTRSATRRGGSRGPQCRPRGAPTRRLGRPNIIISVAPSRTARQSGRVSSARPPRASPRRRPGRATRSKRRSRRYRGLGSRSWRVPPPSDSCTTSGAVQSRTSRPEVGAMRPRGRLHRQSPRRRPSPRGRPSPNPRPRRRRRTRTSSRPPPSCSCRTSIPRRRRRPRPRRQASPRLRGRSGSARRGARGKRRPITRRRASLRGRRGPRVPLARALSRTKAARTS